MAEKIIDKVLPRLSHINSAVVLAGIKCIVKFMSHLSNTALVTGLCKKLTSPISSLINGENETKWVVLKNLQFVAQRHPEIFTDIKCFFIRYNDPSFVKHEKLKMILKLADAKNWEVVVNELNEYAYDIDTDFTQKAVHALWQVCLKVSLSLEKVCTTLSNVLKDLCGNDHGNHFVNEIAIAFQQIMRRYPKSRDYLGPVTEIIGLADSITTADGKVSLLYFCGEFSEKIKNTEEIINTFIRNMVDEPLRTFLAFFGWK
jgi:AP-1 complex subunit beta-1